MVKGNSVSETHLVRGNQAFLIKDSQIVWVVKSGSVALFATDLEAGEPKGSRSYLFSLKPGEALFGLVSSSDSETKTEQGIIAVPLEETELKQLTLQEVILDITKDNFDSIALLEGWINHLGELMGQQSLELNTPVNSIQAEDEQYLSLLKGQNLFAKKNQVIWVEISQGETYYMGLEKLKLDSESLSFPLVYPLWLEAQTQVELSIKSTEEALGKTEKNISYFLSS